MKSFLATAANAGYVLSVQLLALVTLDAADFGSFSLQYLFFALGSSLSLSMISEAWMRTDVRRGIRSGWHDYSVVSLWFALLCGVVTLGVSLLIAPLQGVAVVGAVAVAASVFRTCARYYSLRMHEPRGVLPGDIAGIVVSISVWVAFFSAGHRDLFMIAAAWAAGALASAIMSKPPALGGMEVVRSWIGQHRESVKPLLRDSILMDIGAVGTPYLLAPMLGIAQFGIYRAVSNVASPVRLLLNPLRPTLAALPRRRRRSVKTIGVVILGSVLFGAGAWAALQLIGVLDLQLGTLTPLVAFALPTAIFVTANFIGHFYYILARAHTSGQVLLVGRIVQTVLAVALPIGGYMLGGLSGAIWGYAAGTLVSGVCWMVIVRYEGPSSSVAKSV